MRLSETRLYLVAPGRLPRGDLAAMVGELAGAGVDLIQLREKEMEALDVLRVGEPVAEACRDAGIPFIVNDRPDVAMALAADGVHLGQNDLPVEVARRILGDAIVGRSTHAPVEIGRESSAAREPGGPDYIAVGPVHATPTKPGRPAAGLGLVTHAAAAADLPWFAIGGIDASNLMEVMEAGARRIVVLRAIAGAEDPPAAAAELRTLLDSVPL
jgi:thiamine-phosphate pyrophosphorylase